MMIYDCFTFFNELDLLEIRLNILSPVVDKFVLVEANKTYSGKDKKFYFEENKSRYQNYLDKIVHIKLTDYPNLETSWTMENYQRNMIMRGLKECKPDDIIIISDLDEIPNPDVIVRYQHRLTDGIYCLQQKLYYFYLNYKNCMPFFWYLARIMRYKNILENAIERYRYTYDDSLIESLNQGCTPTKLRLAKDVPILKNGGWHFSYLGGIEAIKYKLNSFSHQEYKNTDEEVILKSIKNGIDLFGRTVYRFIPVEVNKSNFPEYIIKNQAKYSKLIYTDINKIKNLCITIKTIIYRHFYDIPYKIMKKVIKKIFIKSYSK